MSYQSYSHPPTFGQSTAEASGGLPGTHIDARSDMDQTFQVWGQVSQMPMCDAGNGPILAAHSLDVDPTLMTQYEIGFALSQSPCQRQQQSMQSHLLDHVPPSGGNMGYGNSHTALQPMLTDMNTYQVTDGSLHWPRESSVAYHPPQATAGSDFSERSWIVDVQHSMAPMVATPAPASGSYAPSVPPFEWFTHSVPAAPNDLPSESFGPGGLWAEQSSAEVQGLNQTSHQQDSDGIDLHQTAAWRQGQAGTEEVQQLQRCDRSGLSNRIPAPSTPVGLQHQENSSLSRRRRRARSSIVDNSGATSRVIQRRSYRQSAANSRHDIKTIPSRQIDLSNMQSGAYSLPVALASGRSGCASSADAGSLFCNAPSRYLADAGGMTSGSRILENSARGRDRSEADRHSPMKLPGCTVSAASSGDLDIAFAYSRVACSEMNLSPLHVEKPIESNATIWTTARDHSDWPEEALAAHKRSKSGLGEDGQWYCEYKSGLDTCEWKFSSRSGLLHHISDRHVPPKPRKYPNCDKTLRISAMNRHVREQHGMAAQKLHYCQKPGCNRSFDGGRGRGFARKEHLASHMRHVHKGDREHPSLDDVDEPSLET